MTFELRFAGILVAFCVGCSGSPPPAAKAPASTVATSCPSVIGGSVHDLDSNDAALAGASVSSGRPGERGRASTLTDASGAFLLEDAAQPLGDISVYIAEATATGSLPACVDKLLWIGVHTHAASGAPSALSIRMEDRSVDLAAVHQASEHREALADTWLTFYEGFGNVVEGSHGNCAQMAAALEQFVAQKRTDIDAIKQKWAAMSGHEREQLKDTTKRKFASRNAAAQQKAKGIEACKDEPGVHRALRDIPL
jgi:hypothetical protein